MGANPELSREVEAEAPGVSSTGMLGGNICGRRSGRPDCKPGRKRRIKSYYSVVKEEIHMLAHFIRKQDMFSSEGEADAFFFVFQSLPKLPSLSSKVSEPIWCWSESWWLPVWVNRKAPGPTGFFIGPLARRFLVGEDLTGYETEKCKFKLQIVPLICCIYF